MGGAVSLAAVSLRVPARRLSLDISEFRTEHHVNVNGGVKSCHAAAQKSATCGARMRPPGGLRPERGSHVRVAIFEGRQPAFRARLWARR